MKFNHHINIISSTKIISKLTTKKLDSCVVTFTLLCFFPPRVKIYHGSHVLLKEGRAPPPHHKPITNSDDLYSTCLHSYAFHYSFIPTIQVSPFFLRLFGYSVEIMLEFSTKTICWIMNWHNLIHKKMLEFTQEILKSMNKMLELMLELHEKMLEFRKKYWSW